MKRPRLLLSCLFFALCLTSLRAEDGYELWLRYRALPESEATTVWRKEAAVITLALPAGAAKRGPAEEAATELGRALPTLLGAPVRIHFVEASAPDGVAREGFRLSRSEEGFKIAAGDGRGLLYGAFALLRSMSLGQTPKETERTEAPRIAHRMLNHWDDLNRHVERGYAGFSLWEWFYLPEIRSDRYRDYARACASLGINGTVITNVNANALVLTPDYLRKVAALADEFRPFGIQIFLTARFSAPIELGGLKTADPLNPAVRAWWKAKADEIYATIPDFGGFLVKANSEGQPGPQDYQRTHADGANMLGEALAPHGGIVIWRAFVYSHDNTEDRVRQAVTEFGPLDGQFRDNVVVQIKNGPLDFMPREPFSPLFGQMHRTPLALELQITQEYLGQSTQVAYLAPLWKEVLEADTHAEGPGSTVARLIDGSLRHGPSVIAGVANTGTDRNWTGHLLAQANWYAFGRLAWNHQMSSEAIAREWNRLTFGADSEVEKVVVPLLLQSRETVVNYSMPLGLHHIMAEGHHYGPGPWVDNLGRADWNSTYYHRASADGLGFDRTATGSKAVDQYAEPLRALWGNLETCPENLLLWFHHVPWDHRMKSGRPLWDELALRYQQGVNEVRLMRQAWAGLAGRIDAERHQQVAQRLERQELDAIEWRDACLLYFQTFSRRPLPAGVEPAKYSLEHYKSRRLIHMPGHH